MWKTGEISGSAPLDSEHKIVGNFYFPIFVFIGCYISLNLVVAVITDTFIQIRHSFEEIEKESSDQESVKERSLHPDIVIRSHHDKILSLADNNNDGNTQRQLIRPKSVINSPTARQNHILVSPSKTIEESRPPSEQQKSVKNNNDRHIAYCTIKI